MSDVIVSVQACQQDARMRAWQINISILLSTVDALSTVSIVLIHIADAFIYQDTTCAASSAIEELCLI